MHIVPPGVRLPQTMGNYGEHTVRPANVINYTIDIQLCIPQGSETNMKITTSR